MKTANLQNLVHNGSKKRKETLTHSLGLSSIHQEMNVTRLALYARLQSL